MALERDVDEDGLEVHDAGTVMPFGMKNAPATFQHLMSTVMQGVSNYNMYLDDLVIDSSSWF